MILITDAENIFQKSNIHLGRGDELGGGKEVQEGGDMCTPMDDSC